MKKDFSFYMELKTIPGNLHETSSILQWLKFYLLITTINIQNQMQKVESLGVICTIVEGFVILSKKLVMLDFKICPHRVQLLPLI